MSEKSVGGSVYQKLPPGWDCKYDKSTGNCYYINYFTKVLQLEDPRAHYKQLQNERCSTDSIPMQHMKSTHGSACGVSGASGASGANGAHVYPSDSLTAVPAFQERNLPPSLQNISSSPLLSSRGHLEMASSSIPLPRTQLVQTPRLANMTRRSTIQETSFSSQIDTDAVVAKIQNMFPTASENHIRLLLKRYYNREAVVISALQVEKHPVTMPGPCATPPTERHIYHSNSHFYMTPPARRLDMGASRGGLSGISGGFPSRTASPIPGGRFGSAQSMEIAKSAGAADRHFYAGVILPAAFHGSPRFHEQWRSSPKPHSSPKMKLRYMKNIFPKADEMLLLDILANADNNVQTASEKLISLGYVKHNFVPPKASRPATVKSQQQLKKEPDDEVIITLRPKEHTQDEKDAIQALFKNKYPEIAERIIVMALESVNYAEDHAAQILQIVKEEDDQCAKKQNTVDDVQRANRESTDGIVPTDRKPPCDLTNDNDEKLQNIKFQSLIERMASLGPNTELAKGPDEKLLLADYVTWNGANPCNNLGQRQLAKGPDARLLGERSYKVAGHSTELCKGAKPGLAKGSVYSNNSDIRCN